MALFGKKDKKEAAPAPAPVKESKPASVASGASEHVGERDIARVLHNPRITEKATGVQQGGVYTFDVAVKASKREVMEAVRSIYGVTPRKVAVVPVPQKTRRNARTGKSGISHGGKKAYVYLKKGETITIH
ncbi:MAG: 50S ribosomal protein L23 [Patescibacteria group bacterium]|nr:50S ribosomal protein L23 [bacterium]MDZ4227510.1 50S ribosomal protein L23 [Patescibacteria group bacterium]